MIPEDVENEVANLFKEKASAYFTMLYSGQISVEKVHQLLNITYESGAYLHPSLYMPYHSGTAWMHGGHRDFHGGKLCYDCAEELMGAGCGEVNDLRTPGPICGRFCDWCGEGRFNKAGQRVAS